MKRFLVSALTAAVLLAGVAVMPGCNGARDTAVNMINQGPKGFMQPQLVRGTRTRSYGLFIPNNYAASTKYPVIIFLHGIGEGGSDARSNLRVGLAPFVADRQADFPFICIFPQSESGSWDENSEAATDVIAILDDVSKKYSVDPDRVSLTGLSTGGYGTYAIGAKYKARFAALVPMGSNGSGEKFAAELVDMPIHAFCNGGDLFGAFGGNDRGTIEKVKSLGGKYQEFTQTDGPGHDCWEGVYADGELFAWLLQQRRHTSHAMSTPMGGSAPMAASTSMGGPVRSAAVVPTLPAAPAAVRSNASAVVNTPY